MATIINATITNAGLNLLRDAVAGNDNAKITYIAVGTSSTNPTVNDTQLGAESTVASSRKAIASFANGANPGEVTITAIFNSTDAVGVNIQEIGWFGGGSATSSVNTGVLLARALYPHTKLNTEQLTITLDLTI